MCIASNGTVGRTGINACGDTSGGGMQPSQVSRKQESPGFSHGECQFNGTGAAHTSSRQDYETPQALFDKLNQRYGFTIDAAASPENAKLDRYWTEEDDALTKSWSGERVFVNPPYNRSRGVI